MPKANPDIDIGLTALCALAKSGEQLESSEIADVCGCSISAIRNIEWKAMAKIRANAQLRQYHQELCQ